MKQDINQNSNLNNTKQINNIKSVQNNKNIIFYRKSSHQNKKTSFYQKKKGTNSSNIMAQNKNISGSKKKIRLYNNTIEETNPTSKIKSINYSRDKSSIDCNNSSFEKIDIFKTTVSPFLLESNHKSKESSNNENKYINKISQNSKNKENSNNFIIYDNCKINNLTVENYRPKNKSFTNINVSYGEKINNNNGENNNIYLNTKSTKIKNFEKRGINFTFKDNNIKESNSKDLINLDYFENIQKESLNKERNNKCRNQNNNIFNENPKLNNNYITIDLDNSYNNYIKNTNNNNYNNNNYFNKKILYNKNKEVKYKQYQIKYNDNLNNKSDSHINNIQNININQANNLSKGKIIKFKYNGTEFFFHPTHSKYNNKSPNTFHKKESNIIKEAKLIQKWWRKLLSTKILILKHKFNFFVNVIKKVKLKQILIFLKMKILFLNRIIYIQKKWREFMNNKKENISSIYIKNDTYGCDYSNKKNIIDNFYINTSEIVNTIEDNNNTKAINNINNKNNCMLNDLFFGQSYKKKLFHSNNIINNNIIKKKIQNNNCFCSKTKYKNFLNKIILIQRKTKKYLNYIFSYNIRKIYKNLYKKNIIKSFNTLNISKEQNKFSIKGKGNTYKAKFHISNNINIFIKNNKKDSIDKIYNIIKNKDITINGLIQKKKNILNIEKNNEILLKFEPNTKSFKLSNNNFEIIRHKNNDNNIKKFENQKAVICNTNKFNFKSNKIKSITIDNNTIFTIKSNITKNLNKIQNENIDEYFKPPLYKNICLIEKIRLKNTYMKNITNIQKYYRNYKDNKTLEMNPIKLLLKTNNSIKKVYKDNSLNMKKISKIQNIFKNYILKKSNKYFKPINQNIYITKKYIRKKKLSDLPNYKKNNKLNIITQSKDEKGIDKNMIFFNNIDEFFNEKEDTQRINNNNERNSTYVNEAEENRNEIPIKIMHTKLYKNSINFDINNNTNKSNKSSRNNNNNNNFLNIDSLPSYFSIKSISENNDKINFDPNSNTNTIKYKYNNNNNISIQTLESKESQNNPCNKFKDNLIILNNIKRVITEENKYKNIPIQCETENENDNNYFYTENDIARFSFSNGDINILNNSIFRKSTKHFCCVKDYIRKHIIKIFCLKIKKMTHKIKLFIFLEMLIQRMKKDINRFVFNEIFNKKNNNDFYLIIKKHIKIYNEIIKEKNNIIRYEKNDLVKLIKNNIYNKYLLENNKNKFLYLFNEQEKNLIDTNLFINNDKDLIEYYLFYYKIEYKLINEQQYYNLIQFRLIKEPLYVFNIFSITKYMDELYYNIIHNYICNKCYCKIGENCSINCNCHIKITNSINLINKIKNKITHNKSFNKDNMDNFDSINQKEKRNIRIIIKKVKRTSADIIRGRFNTMEESNEVGSSSDIDVFQKMNTGIKSLINKVKINKAFKDFNQFKKNKNSMIKIGRTYSEFGDNVNFKKKNGSHILDNIEYNKYHTIFYNIKNDKNATPEKKIYSFKIGKNIFNEK